MILYKDMRSRCKHRHHSHITKIVKRVYTTRNNLELFPVTHNCRWLLIISDFVCNIFLLFVEGVHGPRICIFIRQGTSRGRNIHRNQELVMKCYKPFIRLTFNIGSTHMLPTCSYINHYYIWSIHSKLWFNFEVSQMCSQDQFNIKY